MPEHCPHCGEQVQAERRKSDDGRFQEVWQCTDCDEEWNHPDETVLNKDLDFSKNKNQISRRDADTDLQW
ncbi:hydrogenase expression protein HypA/HybF (plasmid) [Natrialbaceae archaeon A-arb3/5]